MSKQVTTAQRLRFLHDIAVHANEGRILSDRQEVVARAIVRHCARLQWYAYCAASVRELTPAEEAAVTTIEASCTDLARELGCGFEAVSDPRGCSKLLFPDGASNSFGGRGWCVPAPEF